MQFFTAGDFKHCDHPARNHIGGFPLEIQLLWLSCQDSYSCVLMWNALPFYCTKNLTRMFTLRGIWEHQQWTISLWLVWVPGYDFTSLCRVCTN